MNAFVDISNTILETERLILRPWQESDLKDLYEYASVDGVGQMAGWNPHVNMDESKEILDMFIREKKVFAIVYKENNKVIGSLGLESGERKYAEGLENKVGREIGYVLSKDYWGLGLMPETVERIIQYAFNEKGWDFLLCGHYVENIQSRRVIEKSGFKFIKDMEYENRIGQKKQGKLYILEKKRK